MRDFLNKIGMLAGCVGVLVLAGTLSMPFAADVGPCPNVAINDNVNSPSAACNGANGVTICMDFAQAQCNGNGTTNPGSYWSTTMAKNGSVVDMVNQNCYFSGTCFWNNNKPSKQFCDVQNQRPVKTSQPQNNNCVGG